MVIIAKFCWIVYYYTINRPSVVVHGPFHMVSSALDRTQIEQMVRRVLRDRWSGQTEQTSAPASHNGGPNPLVVNVSARHAHVTDQDFEVLFGSGTKLSKMRDLYQGGEFASEQLINIVGPRNRMIPNVRILGPTRLYTQVEISYTDGVFLGIKPELRISGNHQGTGGCVLVGPAGALNLEHGLVRAKRHVHMSPADAAHYGVEDGDEMQLDIQGPCGMVMNHLTVRIDPKVKLEIHIDTDEGNACDLQSATRMELVKQT